ncbi:MAG: DHHW family protein [Lachnospiraceae bacterium]
MNMLICFVVLSFVLMIAPIVVAFISSRLEKSKPLYIRQENSKNPRYFSISFCKMFEEAWKKYDGNGVLKLSKEEHVIEADKTDLLPDTVCEEIVCSWGKDFTPPAGIQFNKEIYARQNATLIAAKNIRAIACRKNLYIGANTHLTRWADAFGDVTVEENCNLGISVTSKNNIHIGKNSSFRRLYAKEIVFDKADENKKSTQLERELKEIEKSLNRSQDVYKQVERGIRQVNENNTDENKRFNASIITKHKLLILNGYSVQGDVRSHKSVRLDIGAVVCGNIFAEGDVFLENGTRVYGDIFSQGNIYMEDNVSVGQYGKTKSVIARGSIRIGHGCQIFGFVSAEKGGLCCPAAPGIEVPKVNEDMMTDLVTVTGHHVKTDCIIFTDPEEFKALSPSCFRRQEKLASIIIPEGVEIITHSFFYECMNLKSVTLPSSLRIIEDFAFYDCVRLREIILPESSSLEKIGISAFEGCVRLSNFKVPVGVTDLEEAAFRNCEALSTIRFDKDNMLTQLSSHLFQGCSMLRVLQLPRGGEGIISIGMSTFYGCKLLREIPLSEELTEIGKYAFYGCGYQPTLSKKKLEELSANAVTNEEQEVKKKIKSSRKKKLVSYVPAIILVTCIIICAVKIFKIPKKIQWNPIISNAEIWREKEFAKRPPEILQPPKILPLYKANKESNTEKLQTKGQENSTSSTPIEPEKLIDITSEYVVLNTRTMQRYKGTSEGIASASTTINKAMGSLPEGIGKYYFAVPDALSIETDSYVKFSNGYEQAVHDLYAGLTPGIVTIDAFQTLRDHRNEQMFLNTDYMWTTMGARYASNQFLDQLGITPVPLSDYKYEYVALYKGGLDPQALGYKTKTISDRVDFYIWRQKNTELITKMVEDKQEKYQAPTIALSRGGYNIFVGTEFQSAVMSGDDQSKRTLLMVGGTMSRGLAVWLTPYFNKVILLNDEIFGAGTETMQQYIEQYGVTDVMIVGEAMKIASLRAQKKLIDCFSPEVTIPTPAPLQ